MKNRHIVTGFLAMTGIILSLLATTVPAQAAEGTAAQGMRLSKTQGIVAVFDTVNKPQKAISNMKLSSGYNIATSAASYAWINLDDTKLVEMDALSKVKVTSTGKNHVVDVTLGKAFFDVSKNLEKDESLIIRTPSVVASINKGTAAEIRVENGNATIVALDGKIDCVVIDMATGKLKSVEVLSGKMATVNPTVSKTKVATKTAKKDDISGFSKLQIAQDSVLKDRIIKASGSKIGNISVTEAVTSASQDMTRQAAEVIAMANKSGKDVQSVINTMVGADISAKTLGSAKTVTSSASGSGSTDSGSSTSKPVHTHSWDEGVVTKAATCVEAGTRTLTCTGCHQTKQETIPAAHTLGETVRTELESGAGAYQCTGICDRVYKKCTVCNEEVSNVVWRYESHNFTDEISSSVPTCTQAGKQELQCSNDVLDFAGNPSGTKCTARVEYYVGEPLGHAFYKEFYYNSPSCCYYYRCPQCNEYDEKRHVLGGTVPTERLEGPFYIDCVENENGCNYHAKYSWNEERGTYTLDGWELAE